MIKEEKDTARPGPQRTPGEENSRAGDRAFVPDYVMRDFGLLPEEAGGGRPRGRPAPSDPGSSL